MIKFHLHFYKFFIFFKYVLLSVQYLATLYIISQEICAHFILRCILVRFGSSRFYQYPVWGYFIVNPEEYGWIHYVNPYWEVVGSSPTGGELFSTSWKFECFKNNSSAVENGHCCSCMDGISCVNIYKNNINISTQNNRKKKHFYILRDVLQLATCIKTGCLLITETLISLLNYWINIINVTYVVTWISINVNDIFYLIVSYQACHSTAITMTKKKKKQQLLLGLLSWYPVIHSSLCNSFEGWAPVDEIYGWPIFKWDAVTWLNDRRPG